MAAREEDRHTPVTAPHPVHDRAASAPTDAAARRRHAAAHSAWRLLPAAALGVAAGILGGLVGVLLGFLAVLVALDRLLERLSGQAGLRTLEADRAFARLSRQRRRAAIERRLRRADPHRDDLVYVPEDTGWVATASRRQLGVLTVPLDSVVGTVDARKASAFDRCFRPPSFSRGRWTLMFRAVRRGATLPPISVYRVGGEHVVRDGHHRVSVARAMGVDEIAAEVVELI